jgi:hypothetical protein
VLHKGALVGAGTYAELIAIGGAYAELFTLRRLLGRWHEGRRYVPAMSS